VHPDTSYQPASHLRPLLGAEVTRHTAGRSSGALFGGRAAALGLLGLLGLLVLPRARGRGSGRLGGLARGGLGGAGGQAVRRAPPDHLGGEEGRGGDSGALSPLPGLGAHGGEGGRVLRVDLGAGGGVQHPVEQVGQHPAVGVAAAQHAARRQQLERDAGG